MDAEFRLGVFQRGRIELVQDFPSFDHNGDGRVDDNDLLFSVTLRSGKPDQALILPDSDNTHFAGFVQDDWSVSSRLQINAGVRYEFDTEVNNKSRVNELNPIVEPFVTDERRRDTNNFAPRIGFAWSATDKGLIVRGGYGIYYDKIVLQIQSLERGLDGRALPFEVRAGNVFFLDPETGRFPPFAPTLTNPFTGATGGVHGVLLPMVSDGARFNDAFSSLDLRVSRPIAVGTAIRVEPMLEVFNLFNTTNILGTSNVNYSGFSNVLVRDSQDPASAGYLQSSSFGKPVTTAGGVFGSGGHGRCA